MYGSKLAPLETKLLFLIYREFKDHGSWLATVEKWCVVVSDVQTASIPCWMLDFNQKKNACS